MSEIVPGTPSDYNLGVTLGRIESKLDGYVREVKEHKAGDINDFAAVHAAIAQTNSALTAAITALNLRLDSLATSRSYVYGVLGTLSFFFAAACAYVGWRFPRG